MTLLFLSIALFITLSGLLAAMDAAVLSVSRPEISEMVDQGKWGAHRLESVKRTLTIEQLVGYIKDEKDMEKAIGSA